MRVSVRGLATLHDVPSDRAALIQQLLTFKNPDYVRAVRFGRSRYSVEGLSKEICLAERSTFVGGGHVRIDLTVPRGADEDFFLGCDIDLSRLSAPQVDFPDLRRLTLQPEQLEARGAILAQLQSSPTGVYLGHYPTSFGKSILSFSVARLLGLRTLVLVHTRVLEEGWKRDLAKYFDIDPKGVTCIRGSKKLQEVCSLASIDLPPIMIGSLQTFNTALSSWSGISYLNLHGFLENGIGNVVVDECHIVPAETHNRVVESIPSRFRMGFTATPTRTDDKEFLIHAAFGKPIKSHVRIGSKARLKNVRPLTEIELIPANALSSSNSIQSEIENGGIKTITSIKKSTEKRSSSPKNRSKINRNQSNPRACAHVRKNSFFSPPLQKNKNTRKIGLGGVRGGSSERDGKQEWMEYAASLATNHDRTRLICDTVVEDLNHSDSMVALVTTVRVAHVKRLVKHLSDLGLRVGEITGQTSRKETNEALSAALAGEVDVVVASLSCLKYGANIPTLTSLHLASSIGNDVDTEQTIGRVRRAFSGKKRAKVYDYIDLDTDITIRHVMYRLAIYRRHGFFSGVKDEKVMRVLRSRKAVVSKR